MIKSILKFFSAIVSFIKSTITCVVKSIKCLFEFIKNTIDFIYKLVFIAFFCVIAYIGYKVFSSATVINKKLDELKENVMYIQRVSDDLTRTTATFVKINGKIARAGDNISQTGKKISKKFIGLF